MGIHFDTLFTLCIVIQCSFTAGFCDCFLDAVNDADERPPGPKNSVNTRQPKQVGMKATAMTIFF